MKIKNRLVRIPYFLVECPVCGQEFIWILQDFKKRERKCSACKNTFNTSDYPYDELGMIELILTPDGGTIRGEVG